jgi:5S rRNA maturation endonuclease (ribonuclease M5)
MTNGVDRLSIWPEFLDLWESLCLESARPGTTVLVEGERDRGSVRALGLPGRVTLLHQGRTLSQLAQDLDRPGERVIVLTDWDVEGGHLAHRVSELLKAGPVNLDLDYRRRLGHILRGEVAHVEGLAGWARRMAETVGAPLEHFLRPASV